MAIIPGRLQKYFPQNPDRIFNGDNVFQNLFVYGKAFFDDEVRFGNSVFFEDCSIKDLIIKRTFGVGLGSTVFAVNVPNKTVGIFTSKPQQQFHIDIGNSDIVIDQDGLVGIGTTDPGDILERNDGTQGTLRVDIRGSISVDRNIYDSAGSPGANGAFLNRDEFGIRWVTFEPAFSEGIFIQDEGIFISDDPNNHLVGAAQSFTALNFRQINSLGLGTDTTKPLPDANNPTTIARIQTQDLWGYNGVGAAATIYRMTKVGIGTSSTYSDSVLDVIGNVIASSLDRTKIAGITTDGGIELIRPNNPYIDFRSSGSDYDARIQLRNDNTGLSFIVGGQGSATEQFTITGTGRFGFDETSPTQLFQVSSANRDDLVFTDNAELGINTDSPRQFVDIRTPNNNGFVIKDDSSVGINIGDPQQLFHINTLTGNGVVVKSDDSIGVGIVEPEQFVHINTPGGNGVVIKSDDAIGIGTNDPQQFVHIKTPDSVGVYITPTNFVGIGVQAPTRTLDVRGTGYFESNLEVGGELTVTGDTFLDSKLDVDGDTTLNSLRQSLTPDDGALHVDGGVGIKKRLNVGEEVKIDSTTQSTDNNNGALVVDGGVGIASNLNVGGTLDVDSNARIDGNLELDDTLTDINNSTGGTKDYRLAAVGTGVSWRPSGVETENIIWVSKDGDDTNSGFLEGDAKATIGGAAAVAQIGDTIIVRSGVYIENNPIGLRTDVSVHGQDLRLVTVVPSNVNDDIFHVRRGCLIENLNFAGPTQSTYCTGGALAFPPTISSGEQQARSGFISNGPVTPGLSGRWRSPYVRNCTNFMTGSIGMKIDGDFASAPDPGQDLKSMVCDSFTQYNEAGIGVSLTNSAYAQLVSIFTINCEIAIYASSGAQCDLTNSNSSFGTFGLFADGTSPNEFTGILTGYVDNTTLQDVIGNVPAESDQFIIDDVQDTQSRYRKPYDGQGVFFKINLDDYGDVPTNKTGIVQEPLRTIRNIKITNGGSGYTVSNPPVVNVSAPAGPEGILAELVANVSAAGTISSVDIIASGSNFLPDGTGTNEQEIEISFSGNGGATAVAETDPVLFTVNTGTEPTGIGLNPGRSKVTFNEFIPYSLNAGTDVVFRRLSRIITSSHSFEYVGAGTDINRANPFQGGEPIPENEIVQINGAQIPFTSTDQKGNFRIGEGLTIDQTTSTVSGRDFNRAIQANLTPLIIALGGQ